MKYQNPDIESSYAEHDLGKDLYEAVLKHKPKKIIEFGCLYGYSTIAMAMALEELRQGKIIVYDLFDKYQYKHSTKKVTQENINKYGLQKYVELKDMDFEKWLKNPEPFDMMHFDISNNGEKLEHLYGAVKPFIDQGAMVYFEGGTKERDNIDWMNKYGFKKMTESNVPYEVVNAKFPSLSLIKKI